MSDNLFPIKSSGRIIPCTNFPVLEYDRATNFYLKIIILEDGYGLMVWAHLNVGDEERAREWWEGMKYGFFCSLGGFEKDGELI